MLSELHSLNLKLSSKQYNKKFVSHLIVAPQLGSGQWHNYSTKTRQAGQANEAVYVFSYVYVCHPTKKVNTMEQCALKM
jgi:hypothetical protein